MTITSERQDLAVTFLAGGGDMGERIRSFNWSQTPLGPAAGWPQSLKTAVRIMLTSRQPIWIGWGPELIYLYNDPYKAIVGGKHPAALGQPAAHVWPEIWDVIEPMLVTALSGDEGTYVESQLLIMERHGYREETYYTFSYSPIPDDDGTVGGIICANTDDTQRVIGERQLGLLRELATRTADSRSSQVVCEGIAEALDKNPRDLPFALLYLVHPDEPQASLAAATGIEAGHPARVQTIALDEDSGAPIASALKSGEFVVLGQLEETFGAQIPSGSWPEPVKNAVVIPIAQSGRVGQAGALVVGLSPLRNFDDSYRRFLELVAGQVAANLGSVRAYEEERKRAEALAELDRAKTTFFSNVSHEFRTPLTLILGPIEDLLDRSHTELTPAAKAQLEVVHRNSLRLLKLVNTMLDFSRLEAERMQAQFEPTSLAQLTSELASVFRSAIERAGLRLIVDCPPLAEQVYVDRDMWEKVMLNLLSNAFKFTLEGEVRVKLEAVENQVRLTVSDTGVGIPEKELDLVFDRFHRVLDSRGRTHEGTGIGLSLVQELVALHGGSVRAHSTMGEGSRFVVQIPFGSTHLDPRHLRSEVTDRRAATGPTGSVRAEAFIQEALHWLPDQGPVERTAEQEPEGAWVSSALANLPAELANLPAEQQPGPDAGVLPRVLLADDNSDMREYVARLLAERFQVEAVADGQAALEAAIAHPPDLILTDVMMPRLDGLGLLTAIRAEPELRYTPVILLSARVAQDARIEGMEAGADDYLTKPFTARELLARVSAHMQMAQSRRQANAALREQEERLRLALETGRLGAWELDLSSRGLATTTLCKANFGLSPDAVLNSSQWFELIHPEDQPLVRAAMDESIEGQTDYDQEFRVVWPSDGSLHWLVARGQTLSGAEGKPSHLVGVTLDITARKQTQQALEASEKWFRMMADTAPAMLWLTDADGLCTFLSRGWYEFTGQQEAEALGYGWIGAVHPDDRENSRQIFVGANEKQHAFGFDYRLRRADGVYRWTIDAGRPRYSDEGKFLGFIGSVIDVHERKEAEEALKEAGRQKDEFLATLAHELRNPLAPLRSGLEFMKVAQGDAVLVERTRQIMHRQVVHISRLVDDLLDVSRISRGEINLRKQPLALSAIVAEAVETASPSFSTSQHELSTFVPNEPLYVMGDPARLLQVVGNLLNNARKFTPAGGAIDVVLARREGNAVLSVRDTGIGISADQLDRIFEMFTQVQAPGGSVQDGLGIGLTLVKRLVELHDGTVAASSAGIGSGSELTIVLPLSEDKLPQASVAAAVEQPRPAARRRILVVDDNRDAAELLVALLGMSGHEVQAAFDGQRAVACAEQFRPEVVLLDLGLPVLDGYQACRQMRSQPWGADMKIVALTGWGQSDDRKRTKEAGFDEHLVKPVDPAVLKEIVGSQR